MKFRTKAIALFLSLIICIGVTVLSPLAADKDVAPVGALTGLEAIGSTPTVSELSSSLDELPAKYNSRDYGWVLPIRVQSGETCWAFGALSTMETLLLKNGEEITTFAPQHANIWGAKREDGTGWQRTEGSSGYSYIPPGYLTSQAGPVYDYDFPMTSTKDDYNNFTKSPEYALTEIIYFNNNSSTDAIKELIYTYGAVVGNYYSGSEYLSNNTSYYCSDHNFNSSKLSSAGHCVSVVGWDDNYPKDNFSNSKSGTPEKDGAWIIKNSWGTSRGDQGYFYISYEDVWIFDKGYGYSYAFTNYDKLTEDKRIYQNEIDGATFQCNTYRNNNSPNPYDKITYMNVFDFDEDNRTLDKVIFETISKGSDYTVYYIPVKDGKPTADTTKWTELLKSTVDYTGYICADFENIEIPAGVGAIGVEIDNERSYFEHKSNPDAVFTENSLGVCEWLANPSDGSYFFYPQSEYGMSFYMKNGEVDDLMNFYMDTYGDKDGGTFVIKAITDNGEEIPMETTTSSEENTTVPTTTATSTEEISTVPATPATSTEEITTVPTTATTSTEEITTVPTTTASSEENTTVPTATASSEENTTVPTKPTNSAEENPTVPTTITTSTEKITTMPTTNTQNSTTTIPYVPVKYLVGDADMDGKVNVKDATRIQKFIVSLESLSDTEKRAADSDRDGTVNVKDATAIQKSVAGILFESIIGTLITE